ncbi:MAG: proteasome subunit beta [Myxococcota bacterium]|nr:proteasome subunit beta [Myxococcota bacterium]
MRFWDGYKGTSFAELLQTEHPQLAPDFSRWAHVQGSLPESAHGTTVIALRYADGAMVAGDRLATAGHQVAMRDIEKVYATDDYSLMAIAGAAGPAIEMARLLGIQFEHHEKIEGEPLELEGKANTLAQLVKQNLPAAMQGLVVVPLFAGYDRRRGIGRVWKYEATGGRYEEDEFDSVGSGSIFARESLKKSYKAGSSRAEALRMAIEALTDAADEDRGTGGVDELRGIYPRVKFCTAGGIESASDEEIAQVYRDVLGARRRPGS